LFLHHYEGGRNGRIRKRVDNGINVEALVSAREALTKRLKLLSSSGALLASGRTARTAIRRWRASSVSARSSIARRTFAFDADHPEVFASEDSGATPVEYVLVGLASCLTAALPRSRSTAASS
jgi:hypothetical protein